MQHNLTLGAGQSAIQQTGGSFFLLLSTGAATVVEIEFFDGAQTLEHVYDASKGLSARMVGNRRFDRIRITSSVATTVKFVVSDGALNLGLVDGANVTASIANLPLPVSNDRGSPGLPVYVNGTIAGNPTAVALTDDAAVAVTAALTAVVAANANRIRLVFTNLDPANAVALGGAALTWAKRSIILQPGDTWIEDRASNLAWSAICNTGLTASLGVQEVTA